MTNIKDIDPADFAGGVAHVAAGQLFEFLSMTENAEGVKAVNWFGGSSSAAEDLQTTVSAFALYVTDTDCVGETLWRWAEITGMGVASTDSQTFDDLAMPHRLAFSMFATVAKIANGQIRALQEQIRAAELAELANETAPALAVEDSIFEPIGTLGDQEPHQAQFLADQVELDTARLEAERIAAEKAEAGEEQSVGEELQEEPETPAALSVGIEQGATSEEGSTDKGPEAGDEAPADPAAQGDVSDLSDDGSAEADRSGRSDHDASATTGQAGELASPVEEQPGTETGGAPGQPQAVGADAGDLAGGASGADGSAPAGDGSAGSAGDVAGDTATDGVKSKKTKSAD
ncbi:hypothetical protein ACIQUB_07205 [Rhizobium sp. NPDC090275]|uniref:hypothetical protein n=1 Tax=Rhizobium sp. NPDC090275 TaxID=3364498 RepID=UPI00383AA753